MVLYTNDFVALKAHFGQGYLSKALHDISLRGEKSRVFRILHNEEPIGIRMSKVTPIAEEGYVQWIVSSITAALKKIFETTTTFLKNVSWKIIVEAGKVPDYFEAVLAVLGSIATVSADRLPKYTESIYRRLKDLWDYIKSVVYDKLDKKERDVFVDTREETMNLVNLLYKGSAFIVRKIASGLAYFLTEFRKYIVNASYEMAYGVAALLETAFENTEIYAVKRFLFSSGIKIISSSESLMKNAGDHRVKAVLRQFSDVFDKLSSGFSNQLIAENRLDDIISQHWLFKAGYGIVLLKERVSTWLLKHLSWLVRVLRVIVTIGTDFIYRLTSMLSPLFSNMYEDFMKKIAETVGNIETFKAMQIFSQTIDTLETLKKVDKNNADYIESVVDNAQTVARNFQTIQENFESRQDEASFKDINRANALGAELLTRIGFGDGKVTSADLDEFINAGTEFSSLQEINDVAEDTMSGLDKIAFISFRSIIKNSKDGFIKTIEEEEEDFKIGKPLKNLKQMRQELEKVIDDLYKARNDLEAAEAAERDRLEVEHKVLIKDFIETDREWTTRKMREEEISPVALLESKFEGLDAINKRVLAQNPVIEGLKKEIHRLVDIRNQLENKLDKKRSDIGDDAYYTAFIIWSIIGGISFGTYCFVKREWPLTAVVSLVTDLANLFILPPFDAKAAATDKAMANATSNWDYLSALASKFASKAASMADTFAKGTGINPPSFSEALNIPILLSWVQTGFWPYVSNLLHMLKFTVISSFRIFGIVNHMVMSFSYNSARKKHGEHFSSETVTEYEIALLPEKIKRESVQMILELSTLTGIIASNRLACLTVGLSALAGVFGFGVPHGIYLGAKRLLYGGKKVDNMSVLVQAREDLASRKITTEEYVEILIDHKRRYAEGVVSAANYTSKLAIRSGGSVRGGMRDRITTALMHTFVNTSMYMDLPTQIPIECAVCKEHENIEAHCRNCDKMYCAECVGQDIHRL